MKKQFISFVVAVASSYASMASAEHAEINESLDLHIPVIKFQNNYLWADLAFKSSADGIAFEVKEFAQIPPTDVPPQYFPLSKVTTEQGEPEIVDITANSARLTFVSGIPLACTVVYGKTMDLGSAATDPNMNGGAIIDHNPVLIGLEANTLYYYRVQGSDQQGNFYWSPLRSFNTSAAALSDPNLLSLNNGATVTAVSSNFGGAANDQTWGANSALDGSSGSAWSSSGDGDNAFLEVTLPQTEHIGVIEVWSRAMSNGTAIINSFTITIDNGEVLGPFTLPDTQQAHSFMIDRITTSVKLDVATSTGGNTGLVEFAAYAADEMMM